MILSKEIIKIWKIFFFLTFSGGLGYLIIQNGWEEINADKISIIGSKRINSELIVRSSGKLLPNYLLAIHPKELKIKLKENLPIKHISIRKKLLPPHLNIKILEIIPIAYATRNRSNGIEKGILDINGYWIPLNKAKITINNKNMLSVEGWMEIHRLSIAKILKNKDNFGSPIRKVIFHQDGEISIETNILKEIQLGTNLDRLDKKIAALNYLSKNLPEKLRGKVQSIDLRNVSQPELQIAKP